MSPLNSPTLRIGDQAPLFTLRDLDGRPFELTDVLQGGGALLLFGPGTWSRGTRRQVPEIELAHEELAEAGFTTLLVVTEDASRAKRTLGPALNRLDRSFAGPLLSFPILADENRAVAKEYGLYRAISLDGLGVTRPAAFLISSSGEIRFMYVGRNDADIPDTQSLVWLARELATPVAEPPLLLPPGDVPEIRPWDLSTLPHIETEPWEGELATPAEAISLPEEPDVIRALENDGAPEQVLETSGGGHGG